MVAPAKPPPAEEPRVVARNELPPDVQRVLPPLAMSGSVYSPTARNRMVIVDGRLTMEGEQVAQGLFVERINPKSVVMRYQNHRFNVPL
jgi:general secretion pathway protein B